MPPTTAPKSLQTVLAHCINGDGAKLNDFESTSNSSTDSENDSTGVHGPRPAASLPRTNNSMPVVEPTAPRTVRLLNLADGTAIQDVTSVVRGGLLVNIYFRARDNTISLSFLHSADAHAFYQYVQDNGLYIKNTKVVTFAGNWPPTYHAD
ncbi:RNA recognition motif containing protein [Metarhizium album ARSEF 1941]|uniref:RNA recognition motif containing protein n=1 Tax=Metarhizium album (strain ARSEF 1941) TaxID=1081103 RepID=A0A0B2X6D9_METAS|nr:RNA recognition motif containing protein [Metarhizium album ARSEF 1941]KHO00851.1 RNA recognition motif containing protein [Metarhizium album ARSEF 1941]